MWVNCKSPCMHWTQPIQHVQLLKRLSRREEGSPPFQVSPPSPPKKKVSRSKSSPPSNSWPVRIRLEVAEKEVVAYTKKRFSPGRNGFCGGGAPQVEGRGGSWGPGWPPSSKSTVPHRSWPTMAKPTLANFLTDFGHGLDRLWPNRLWPIWVF